MIGGIGVDVVDIPRFARSLERTSSLSDRLFLPDEAALSVESRAGRFAAKEAFAKALKVPKGMTWHDIEVVTDERGAPSFVLHGVVADRCAELGVTSLHLSISHDTTVATAFVVAEC